jgi:protein-S-isoprenylcysteine O-methyltransferase Ste14
VVALTKILLIIGAFIGYVLIILAFQYATNQAKRINSLVFRELKDEVKNGFAIRLVFSLIYYFCLIDWIFGLRLIAFSYLPLPVGMNWFGLALLLLTAAFFWWIHLALGANYHGPKHLHANHRLITRGPYRTMRHPTYAGFLLMHCSYFFITGNWLLLLSGIVMSSVVNHYRMIEEEKLLLARFGKDYEDYQSRTWKLIPKIRLHAGKPHQSDRRQ